MEAKKDLSPTSIWQGKTLRLQAIEPSDWETYFVWDHDDEQARGLYFIPYYFQELRYQKVTVSIYSFNEPSIRLHEHLGFRQEGCIRRTVFTRGQYFDELIYGLTREEFDAKYVTLTHLEGVNDGR